MKLSDAKGTALVALGTMAVTLALAWPGALNAGKDGPAPPIASPTLTVDGAQVRLEPVAAAAPGDKPTVKLIVTSTSAQPVHLTAKVAMLDQAPTPPVSRVGAVSRPIYQTQAPAMVRAGATQTITLTPDQAVQAGHRVSYSVTVGDKTLRVPGFTVPGTPAPAGPRAAPANPTAAPTPPAAPLAQAGK